MKYLIIAHRDEDGIVAAVSYAWNLLEKENKSKTIENIFSICDIVEYTYYLNIYDVLKEKKLFLENYKQIILLDCSFPEEIMKEFHTKFKNNFIWIDHHKKGDEDIEKEVIGITGLRDSNNSACVLVWKYFNKGAPELSRYIEDMDLWKWELNDSKEFFAGFPEMQSTFTKEMIEYIFNLIDFDNFEEKKQKIMEKGKIIREHQRDHVQKLATLGEIVNFEGYKSFVINTIFHPSLISEFLLELPEYKDIDIFLIWYRDHKSNKYKISLRSHRGTVDLSIISKKFGGGGHPRASAFNIDNISELKFKKWEENE